jgi:hypothetical protein
MILHTERGTNMSRPHSKTLGSHLSPFPPAVSPRGTKKISGQFKVKRFGNGASNPFYYKGFKSQRALLVGKDQDLYLWA